MRNVSTLAWTSSLGIAALVTAVVVSTMDSVSRERKRREWIGLEIGSSEQGTMSGSIDLDISTVLGNAGYLYLISTAILPITQSMSRPKNFQKIVDALDRVRDGVEHFFRSLCCVSLRWSCMR